MFSSMVLFSIISWAGGLTGTTVLASVVAGKLADMAEKKDEEKRKNK